MTNRERMQRAIEGKPETAANLPPPTATPQPAKKPKKSRPPTPGRRDEIESKGRYPDGTAVNAIYVGGKWRADLTVPGLPVVSAESTGVHDCLTKLWQKYQELTATVEPSESACPPDRVG